jgi:hypothetical protein
MATLQIKDHVKEIVTRGALWQCLQQSEFSPPPIYKKVSASRFQQPSAKIKPASQPHIQEKIQFLCIIEKSPVWEEGQRKMQ